MGKIQMNTQKIIWFGSIFLLLVVSCQPALNVENPIIVDEETIAQTQTEVLPTFVVSPTVTATWISTLLPTDSSTPQPTINPLPTITPTILVSSTVIQTTMTPEQRISQEWIPISDNVGRSIEWSNDGKLLYFSLFNQNWPAHVQFLPIYQSLWEFDLGSKEKRMLPMTETQVSYMVRESLGICPYPLPESLPYPCQSTIWESLTSERIVFSSGKIEIEGDANSWLANVDGSDVQYLETIIGSPEDVKWSGDGEWLLIGHYAGTNGSNLYYLVKSDGSFVQNLETLTGISHFRVQGPTPQFSPDGKSLAFVGVESDCKRICEELDDEAAYNLYTLDLATLEIQLVSSRFGMFHWADDGNGFYVLDGSANTVAHSVEYVLDDIQKADLYYISLMQEPYSEQKIAEAIPLSLPYKGSWAFSPEANAMAGTFAIDDNKFGIIKLENLQSP